MVSSCPLFLCERRGAGGILSEGGAVGRALPRRARVRLAARPSPLFASRPPTAHKHARWEGARSQKARRGRARPTAPRHGLRPDSALERLRRGVESRSLSTGWDRGTKTMAGLLSRERIVAPAGFNRWLVPPAALAIHLCIGQAYAISVFNLPLSRAIGITQPAASDWKLTTLGWIYTLAIVFLGLSAAFAGTWLERAGPRKVGVVAACCWGGGFLLAAIGVKRHQIGLVYLGYGVIGGCGLGLGYVSPVSTLIKWFPDRRGMATGMAIMGFGGGALIGAPLADTLMKHFATPTDVGVAKTFIAMGTIYFVAMTCGAFGYRLPPPGWRPAGWTPSAQKTGMITAYNVHVSQAWRTPQFWLLWMVLCMNVSAGSGVIGIASP